MKSDNFVFSVRPIFVGWINLLVQLPLQLFFTFRAGGFFGGTSQFLAQTTGLFTRGSQAPCIFFDVLAFF